jgi:DNA-binding CsgD family transcriptional regulator
MYDVSDRFLHQLAADRRASLLHSGRASSKRPFRRALGAGLARLSLVADRNRSESASLHQPRPAPTNSRGTRGIPEGLTGSTQSVGEPAGADGVTTRAAASTSPLRQASAARVSDGVLTQREHQVVLLVAEGLTNAEIAQKLWISPGTVRRHLENVFAKLGVHTRTAAVARVRDGEPCR